MKLIVLLISKFMFAAIPLMEFQFHNGQLAIVTKSQTCQNTQLHAIITEVIDSKDPLKPP